MSFSGTTRATRSGARWCALALCISLSWLAICAPAAAQDDKRVSREREALRRSQSALQAAQDQLAALQREKDKWAADLARAEAERVEERAAAAAQLTAAQAQARAQRERADRLQTELGSAQTQRRSLGEAAAQQQKQHEAQAESAQARIAGLSRDLAERTAANASLVALLERSVASLAQAEQANRSLYAVAEDILAAYRAKGVRESIAQRDPFFGLKAVELENRAEELRTRIAQQRLATTPASAAR